MLGDLLQASQVKISDHCVNGSHKIGKLIRTFVQTESFFEQLVWRHFGESDSELPVFGLQRAKNRNRKEHIKTDFLKSNETMKRHGVDIYL